MWSRVVAAGVGSYPARGMRRRDMRARVLEKALTGLEKRSMQAMADPRGWQAGHLFISTAPPLAGFPPMTSIALRNVIQVRTCVQDSDSGCC